MGASRAVPSELRPGGEQSPESTDAHRTLKRGTYRDACPKGPQYEEAPSWSPTALLMGRTREGEKSGRRRKTGPHPYLTLSITGVSRTRKSRCCWGFCGPFFTSPRGEGGGEKGGNRSPGSKTMCSSSCHRRREEGGDGKGFCQRPLFPDSPSKGRQLMGLGTIT